ncbi:MAG: hypothetical protein EBV06_00435 [Planctomycetia bacterium]|nr:hypothetical protein [Planctomycetia bacterium]
MAKAKPKPAAPAAAKPKVDYTAVFLRYGDRSAIISAGSICILLILTGLFWPGSGFLAESPDGKAKVLEDKSSSVSNQLASAKPTEADLPPQDGSKSRLSLDTSTVKPNDYMLASLVPDLSGSVGLGRRVPKVFSIDEASSGVGRVQVKSYIFDPKFEKIKCLEAAESKQISLALRGIGRRYRSSQAGGAGALGGIAGAGAIGGMSGPGGPGGMAGMGGLGGVLGMPGQVAPGDGEKKDKRDVWVSLDALEKRTGVVPALQIRPLRVAVIAATFPYKKQIEEFQAKLSLRSVNEVLAEGSAVAVPAGTPPLPAFRFLGVDVERRELDGDGKPKGEWSALDVSGDYRKFIAYTGKEFEMDTGDYSKLIVPGLAMPKLKQFRASEVAMIGTSSMDSPMGSMGGPGTAAPPMGAEGSGKPPMPGGTGIAMGGGDPMEEKTSQYPPVENDLKNLAKTLEALKAKPATAVVPSRFTGADSFDPFNPNAGNPVGGTGPGGTMGEGSFASPSGPGNPMGSGSSGMGGAGGYDTKPLDLPEHCLVRIIDINVQPGQAYEYRLRIKMSNPNQSRKDVASPAYAQGDTLLSEWSSMPIRVRLEPELYYFAVDQMTMDLVDNPRNKYEGPYRLMAPRPNMLMLQAHRWVTESKLSNGASLIVGEWSVAERFPVYKGEYVGRSERTKVPVWRHTRESFTIPTDSNKKSPPPGIDVDFGYSVKGPQPEAILVDFNRGQQVYERVVSRTADDRVETRKTSDDVGLQALLLNPDGRLVLLEGAIDSDDKERDSRVMKVRKRINDVEKSNRPTPGAGGNLFGGGGSGSN